MKHRLAFHSLLLLVLFLALVPTALASTTWYVNGVNGSDNNNCKSPQHACKTIGHAISLAHSGDSIMVAAATYTENLGISFSLTIVGSSASTTIIDGGLVNTVVTISKSSANVTLSKLTIRNGFVSVGGGINNSGTLTMSNSTVSGNIASGCMRTTDCCLGGGIYNNGTLTINNSTISGNSVFTKVFTTLDASGGGIYNDGGMLRINNSTISGNGATGDTGFGDGIGNNGPLTINNSTISGNSANLTMHGSGGGGIYSGGTLTISNSTLSHNSAGNIVATAILQNSIVANSPSGGNCSGTMTSNGYNLSSDNTCNFKNSGDLNNTDPKLGQLGNYGGPTQTIPLLSGSPAIDAGNPSGCTDGTGHLLKTDQRGKPRHDKEDTGGCDMGAYERQKE